MDEIDYLGASGSVLSYNLYSYCENAPICSIDVLGNKKVKMTAKNTLITGMQNGMVLSIILLNKEVS